MTYYLRVEAVNLSSFIEDTQDLSTTRGGGLLLLDSVREIGASFEELKPISTGASNGLFSFDAEDDLAAANLKNRVRSFLYSHPMFSQATFVVDTLLSGQNFLHDRESILARTRWQQWQQPTVVMPERNDRMDVGVCPTDKIRPGTDEQFVGAESKRVSRSVAVRRRYGVDQKRNFYASELERYGQAIFTGRFVNDLESLTNDPTQGKLHRKMAVIYLDGNAFGRIQRQHCRSEEESRRFDNVIKRNRAHALKSILDTMTSDPQFQTESGELRFETLLWGGDELVWVVPAWKGWEVLSLFYQLSRDWEFAGEKLTHAAGLVFCHHNAPIHRIVRLCRTLAEEAKEDRARNLFQYLALESFDHIGCDLRSFRNLQLPVPWKISLEGDHMPDIRRQFHENIRPYLPRNKVYAGLHAALTDAKAGGQMNTARFEERLADILSAETVQSIQQSLQPFFGGAPGVWLHLADLWDYLPEVGI